MKKCNDKRERVSASIAEGHEVVEPCLVVFCPQADEEEQRLLPSE